MENERLLTDEEMLPCYYLMGDHPWGTTVAQVQDAKTAAAIHAEYKPLVDVAERLDGHVGHASECPIVQYDEATDEAYLDPNMCNCIAKELSDALRLLQKEVQHDHQPG